MPPHSFVYFPQGLQDYATTMQRMEETAQNVAETGNNQTWCIQHSTVYTAGVRAHKNFTQWLNTDSPPEIVPTNRGGLLTFHGPGQLIIYPIWQLQQFNLNTRTLVQLLEESVIELLASLDIVAQNKQNAPGIYCSQGKLASLGLRIRKGVSTHGISLNVSMDIQKANKIIPCGLLDTPLINIQTMCNYTLPFVPLMEQWCDILHRRAGCTYTVLPWPFA